MLSGDDMNMMNDQRNLEERKDGKKRCYAGNG